MIVGCIGVYGERVEQALVGINRLRPHTDRYVVIVDDSVTEEQREQLKAAGCEVYYNKWEDSMVKMRNQYLAKVQTGDWVVVHDPDEWFNEDFCKNVKKILAQVESKPIDVLLINSHDTFMGKDGKSTTTTSDFFKNLIFHKRAGTHYEGVGEVKEVHETLIIPGMQQQAQLDKRWWYEHVKYWWEVWERAARNVFMGGGGNNAGQKNPSWLALRKICDDLDLKNWPTAREYFRKGGIHKGLKEWLWANRFEGWDYQHEMLEFGRWYFEYLHPEEAEGWAAVTELTPDSPPEVMRFVEETYRKVLGRDADQEGKQAYTQAILAKEIQREQLPTILLHSKEHVEKASDTQTMKIQVPVDVTIKVNEEVIVQTLMKSDAWTGEIKPKLDLGTFFQLALGPEKWKEFLFWFYKTLPGLEETVDKLRSMI